MNELNIKQIIPAPDNLYVVYKNENDEFESKVVCLALCNNDEIVLMDMDDMGHIAETSGFKRVIYK